MAGPSVADLVRQGRIERVTPDVVAAWDRLGEAKIHLTSSEKLAKSDPILAYLALYDASRKAITAHMQANGYRATNRAGAHQAVGLYAEATFGTSPAAAHVRRSTGCARSATAVNTNSSRSPNFYSPPTAGMHVR